MDQKDVKVTLESRILSDNDYTVTYSKNVDKGTATAVLTGNPANGFTGSKRTTYKIAPAIIKTTDISFASGKAEAPFMKGEAKPTLTISINDLSLTEGKDFVVTYRKNKNVTTEAVAKVNGKGNYSGTVTIPFAIVTKAIDSEGVTVVAKDKELKKGKWQQTFKVYDADGKVLKAGKDYVKEAKFEKVVVMADGSVSYNDVTDVIAGDTIRISVTGMGNYVENGKEASVVTGTYRILDVGKDISKAKIKIAPQSYNGSTVTLIADETVFTTAKLGSASLFKDGKPCFEILEDSYQKNDRKGTAKVTIRGIGEFGGEKTVTFKITQRNISEDSSWWKDLMEKLFG